MRCMREDSMHEVQLLVTLYIVYYVQCAHYNFKGNHVKDGAVNIYKQSLAITGTSMDKLKLHFYYINGQWF